jgi:hypothetical protein
MAGVKSELTLTKSFTKGPVVNNSQLHKFLALVKSRKFAVIWLMPHRRAVW